MSQKIEQPTSQSLALDQSMPAISPGSAHMAQFERAHYQEEGLQPTSLAQILARRAKILAQEPEGAPAGQKIDLLVFRLGHERYGIEVSYVQEIYNMPLLTPVPRTPNFVAGVFSARGRILAVVDLWAFLGLPTLQAEAHGQRKIIVVTNGPALPGTPPLELALLVDEVINVAPIFAQEIKPPLATHAFTEYIQGLTSDLLIVLNLSALLNEKRLILNEDI